MLLLKSKAFLSRLIGPLILIILLMTLDLKGMWQLLLDVNLGWILLAALISFSVLLTKIWRWQTIMAYQKLVVGIRPCFDIGMASFYLSMITPGRLGEASRAWFLEKQIGVSVSYGLSSVVLDRWFDVLALCLCCLGFLWFSPFPDLIRNSLALGIGGLGLLCLALMSRRFGQFFLKLVEHLPFLGKFRKHIDLFHDGFLALSWKAKGIVLLQTLMTCVLLSLQYYIVSHSMALSLGFVSVCLAVFLGNMMSYLPISVAGLGTREAAVLAVFSYFPVGNEAAMSFSLLVLLTSLLFNIPMGFLCLERLRKSSDGSL